MINRQTARLTQISGKSSYSAAIIRFPPALSRRRHKGDERRPSLALNVFLVLLLVLACFVWEAMAAKNDAAQSLRQSAVTSPRAVAGGTAFLG
jgi:hypothetical protein